MAESQEVWLQRQAIELLAQHIQFETDLSVKSECIEELRGLVLRGGKNIDRVQFGCEARSELVKLGLWNYFADSSPIDYSYGDDLANPHGRVAEDDEPYEG